MLSSQHRVFKAKVRCLASKKASINSAQSIESSVSRIISMHQRTMPAGESALLLDEEAVVSRIIAIMWDKREPEYTKERRE
jgi:hypothetical protein